MDESKMKKHVTVVGALHIGLGTLGLIGALVIFFALSFARSVVGNEEIPSMVLGFLSVSLPLLLGGISTVGVIGGIGVLTFKPWARIVVMVVSVIGCINIPIGTLAGVYSLWVLMQEETVKLFKPVQSATTL
jgi:hypothetical protein